MKWIDTNGGFSIAKMWREKIGSGAHDNKHLLQNQSLTDKIRSHCPKIWQIKYRIWCQK